MNTRSLDINQFRNAYFIGIGGIGMSAIARYFNSKGWNVAGYDKTKSPLTEELENEGIEVHYNDLGENIPDLFLDIDKTLVVLTPAIPESLGELNFVKNAGHKLLKRSQLLGIITRDSKALCVAGTHGKTTTSTMLAHILHTSSLKCNAFLGGISTNFNSNFVSNARSEITVIEADEFDRSFLELNPFASIITSTDADHLDVYGDMNEFHQGFQAYADLIDNDGFMVHHKSVKLNHPHSISYGIDMNADYDGHNLRFEHGKFLFDVRTPEQLWKDVELGIPGIHNAANAIACIALCEQMGIEKDVIRVGLSSFQGVKRRFEYHVKSPNLVYIDDYAHHPTEISALISSVKLLYPEQKITCVFQPHLFSRTRDFFDGFIKELNACDEVILLPIYPARELPIEGITSEALNERLSVAKNSVQSPQQVLASIKSINNGVIITAGAGDIDRLVSPIKKILNEVVD